MLFVENLDNKDNIWKTYYYTDSVTIQKNN